MRHQAFWGIAFIALAASILLEMTVPSSTTAAARQVETNGALPPGQPPLRAVGDQSVWRYKDGTEITYEITAVDEETFSGRASDAVLGSSSSPAGVRPWNGRTAIQAVVPTRSNAPGTCTRSRSATPRSGSTEARTAKATLGQVLESARSRGRRRSLCPQAHSIPIASSATRNRGAMSGIIPRS